MTDFSAVDYSPSTAVAGYDDPVPARRPYTWKRALAFACFLFVMSASILVAGKLYIVGVTPAHEVAMTGSIPEQLAKTVQEPGAMAFGDRDRLNILCLGVDYNYDKLDQHFTKWVRSDTMFVVSIDKKGETLNVVSIPRDLRVELPGLGEDKINAAYAHEETGDLKLARATVEHFLGIPMDHYVVVKEYAAKAIVDAVGGVTVNVDKDMNYDDNWGHLHIHLKKGVQKLSGDQAVGFVRFRHDEEGDRGRIRRQQQFLDSLLKELKKPSYTTYNEIAAIFKKNVETDLSTGEMIDIANIYRKFDRKKMKTARIDGEDVDIDQVSYIIPDEREKNRIVQRMLMNHDGFYPDEVKIEVLNGSDQPGAAREFANLLSAKGYNVVNIDTAAKKAGETYIEDHRNMPAADRALQDLMGQTLIVDGRSKIDPKADLTVVIGQDWRARYKAYEAQQAVSPADSTQPR
jgi:LCP family protein required for cell wall assembly